MKISFNEMDNILRTLPIGYYAKKRIPTKLDHAETSYFNVVDKTITVSYEGVNIALENVPADEMEMAVRSSLYHEVSHALLTSTNFFNSDNKRYPITPEFNIVEDERIETICKDAYLNVDFIKNRYLINGLKPFAPLPTPTNVNEAFYNLVRFHQGTEKWLNELKVIIDRFKYNTTDSDLYDWYNYYSIVENFYERFAKEYNANPETYLSNSIACPFTTDLQGVSSETIEGNERKEENEENKENEENTNDIATEKTRGVIDNLTDIYKKLVRKYTLNPKVANQLEMILANFNKKNGGGASITAYSGRLNPRQMIRDEYKIFERKSSIRGSNTYGSLHLNLFIDVSGSFWHNENEVNQLLCCLQELETKYPYFSFDLVKCGVGEQLAEKNQRLIRTGGGNRLDKKVITLFRQLQKPQTQNCNIMLFDGDCFPENGVFSSLDNSNLTIIAERENRCYLEKMTKAKIIYENHEYCKRLIENITNTMARSFK